MCKWKDFHGCIPLDVKENISFLKYIENSDRINTEEGKFLHYQYLIELMSRQGLTDNTLPSSNGSYLFYSIEHLQNKIDGIKKRTGWSRMMIPALIRYIKTIENMYNEEWYNTSIITNAFDQLKDFEFNPDDNIKNIVKFLIDNLFNLMITNNDVIYNTFGDAYIKKEIKFKLLTIKELLSGWYNNKYKFDNMYLFNMDIKPFSMEFQYTGYNIHDNKIHNGIKNINNMGWLNI